MPVATTPAANVVLVHGAFADGSSWAEVVAHLQAADLRVIAVQNPLTSLAEDVATTQRALAKMEGPTVLVGHSYGGVVITQAGVDPKVSALVYVAALAPEPGEDFESVAANFPPSPGGASFRVHDGFLSLDPDGFVHDFMPDVDPARARVLAAVQGPVAAPLFSEKTTETAWRDKPCFYALSTHDRLIAPEMQRFLADRMGATTIELEASHATPVSRPREIAELIIQAAKG
ncbi:MAG: alpha/beta hydrolase [Sphingobium sp.]|nr:alpha/beta hydrolase [Sphingobium sp.]